MARKVVSAPAAGPIDLPGLIKKLERSIEAARMRKATAMLKADRFQLFAEVDAGHLIGVVKSQTDHDLFYSCRLGSDGSFACCTQNLNVCGGLRGALCKHLLVLMIGLVQAGQLDAATADAWASASKKQKPVLDRDAMSQAFIRYKGAQAGEVDWRPTETMPEDYYAL
ncbi:MAG TPA: hypothetical protein VM734_36470 [Kofleriaceae bacterium]|nr:hypothetical protein [Kofleriaceae bacterium]